MKSNRFIFGSLFTFILMGCNKEDNILEEETAPLLTVVTEEGYPASEGSYFFISSIEGELIGTVEVTSSASSTTIENDNEVEDFVLHRFIKTGSSYSLISRLGVSPRQILLRSGVSSNTHGGLLGFANMKFENVPQNDGYHISPSTGGSESLNEFGFYRTPVFENLDETYLFLKSGESGMYRILADIDHLAENVFSLHDMNSAMDRIIIDMGGHMLDHGLISALGEPSSPIGSSGLTLYNSNSYPNFSTSNNIELLIPEALDNYPHLKSRFSFLNTADNDNQYSMSTSGFIPDELKIIDAKILSTDVDIESLKMETEGNFDFIGRSVSGSSNEEGFIFMDWTVFSEDGEDLVFPQLPAEIISRFPEFSKEAIVNKEYVQYDFSLINISYLDGYDSYIENLYPETFVDRGNSTSLSTSYFFSTDETARVNRSGNIDWLNMDHFNDLNPFFIKERNIK